MKKPKAKPCAIPNCPALRAKNSYVCAAHKQATPTGGTPAARGHKYGAIATTVEGIRFDSKAEAAHYQELRLREKAGDLSDLRRQTRWPLQVNGQTIGSYVSDFDYVQFSPLKGGEELVVVDVKGMKTPLYQWKKKHFEAQYSVTVTEILKPS